MSQGLSIGFRKGAKGGTWIARHYVAEHGRKSKSLGTADDVVDADGVHVLSFDQAQEAARVWFKSLAATEDGVHSGPFTVDDAIKIYLQNYTREGGKALGRMKSNINTHISPMLGKIEVSRLTRRQIEKWRDEIVSKPPRLRTGVGKEQKYREVDMDDPDVIRRRRHTANKILTILKAALTFAYDHSQYRHMIVSDDAWASVKPFKKVDVPNVRYLTDADAKRLVNTCPKDLRRLVTAALLTGCRYSELARVSVRDFNADSGTLLIPESKSGKPRHVALTEEGRQFFSQAVAGKNGGDFVFLRESGSQWKAAHQYRPLKQACERANIFPAIGFHILRHTYASRLAMKGVPMMVIAEQLGHSDTRITERHYAHLSDSYVADTVRAAFDDMGLIDGGNVIPISGTE